MRTRGASGLCDAARAGGRGPPRHAGLHCRAPGARLKPALSSGPCLMCRVEVEPHRQSRYSESRPLVGGGPAQGTDPGALEWGSGRSSRANLAP